MIAAQTKMNISQNFFILILLLVLSYFLFHVVKAGLIMNFSDQLSSRTIDSASNHTIVFTTASSFTPDDTLELYFETDFDLSRIDYSDLDFKDDNVDLNLGATPGTGAGSNIGVAVSGQTITFTQNDTDTVLAGSQITIAIGTNADHQVQGDNQIYNPSVADDYLISLSGTFGDMGTLSVQILNSDSVGLAGEITPELRFVLRNSSDTDNFTSCALGMINSTGISQCSYRLAAETNAYRGLRVYIQADGSLRNSSNAIMDVSENSQVEQGIEGYGISVQAGTDIIEEGDFADDDTPISTGEQLLIKTDSVYNYIEGNLSTSTLITHKVSASPQTPAGAYNQQVIYTILANY